MLTKEQVGERSLKIIREYEAANEGKAHALRICPECGMEFKVFAGQGGHRKFCRDSHSEDFRKRCAVRGKILVPYALAWRTGRPGGGQKSSPVAKQVFAELNRILDIFAEEDRKAGRPKLVGYVGDILASGFTYMDRKRPKERAAESAPSQ